MKSQNILLLQDDEAGFMNKIALAKMHMADYKKEASQRIPELQLDKMENPMQLWIELLLLFEDAYKTPKNDDLIKRIYQFAGWCLTQPQQSDTQVEDDIFTAVCFAFIEHIPLHSGACNDMPCWFTLEDVMELESIFRYHLSEGEFMSLRQNVADNQFLYQNENWLPKFNMKRL